MTLDQFNQLNALTVASPIEFIPYRRGQAIFNKAMELDPSLDIPEDVDCFYSDEKILAFMAFVGATLTT